MITTSAPVDEATAAATRGPGPKTSLPRGRTSATNVPSIGEATTTPAAKAPTTTVAQAIRSALGRATSRYTVPSARIGTFSTAPKA